MHVIAHRARRSSVKTSRQLLGALEALIALSAVGGGIYGLAGAKGVPREWLEGSPFDSYLIPSLVLLAVVGGSMLVSLCVLVGGHRHAADVALAAGLVLLGWIAVEITIIPFSWLQPVYAALGFLVVVLAVRLRRHAPARFKGTP